MLALIAAGHGRGERAFLHVLVTNTAAIALYERLGFVVRKRDTVTACGAPDRVDACPPPARPLS